jgi:hypothetical protein
VRESKIQLQVVEFGRALGMVVRKLNFGEGWPDYMFLYDGRVMFIEFKAPGKKPEPLQLVVHQQLREAGAIVHVIDEVEYGKQVIRQFL